MYRVVILLLYIVINIFISGINIPLASFSSLNDLLVSYDSTIQRIIMLHLVMNYTFILILIIFMAKKINEVFGMKYYIMARKRKKILLIILKEILIAIIELIVLKLASDILMSPIESIKNINIGLKYYFLIFLTCIIWSLFMLILYSLNISNRKIIFITLALIFVIQYLSYYVKPLNIFIICNQITSNYIIEVLILKLILCIILFTINYYLFNKLEIVGGNVDD